MKKEIIFVLAVSCVAFAQQSDAQVVFQAPMQFAGTGCKIGSSTVAGEGTDTLTIQFTGYDAAKPKNKAASKMDNSACSFVVPVNVPQGFQVSMTADWYGYAEGSTQFFREYFFAGQRGPQKTTNPRGNFTERDDLMHATWSGCKGGTVPFRVNSRIRAVGNPSYITLGASPLEQPPQRVTFHLKSRACR